MTVRLCRFYDILYGDNSVSECGRMVRSGVQVTRYICWVMEVFDYEVFTV